jgi:hypothetical protein
VVAEPQSKRAKKKKAKQNKANGDGDGNGNGDGDGDVEVEEVDPALLAMLGSTGGFGSTKVYRVLMAPCRDIDDIDTNTNIDRYHAQGKKVVDADVSAVNLSAVRQYRQYMNRRGGFHRPTEDR